MSYLSNYDPRGLADDFSVDGGGLFDAVGRSIDTSIANFDANTLDWHEWALIVIGGYVVLSALTRAGRSARRSVRRKVRRTREGFRRRGQALRTVVTG